MKEKLRKLRQSVRQSMATGITWAWAHKLRIAVLAIVFALIAPRPAKTQFLDPCCAIMQAGLASISSALSHVIGGGLNSVLSTDQAIHSFQQTVVWPQGLISQAQGLVGTLRGVFSQTESLIHTPVASATLPSTQQLETILLSRNATQIPNMTSIYAAVYGPVPGQTNAPPSVRNMIDMSDAVAQDAMSGPSPSTTWRILSCRRRARSIRASRPPPQAALRSLRPRPTPGLSGRMPTRRRLWPI